MTVNGTVVNGIFLLPLSLFIFNRFPIAFTLSLTAAPLSFDADQRATPQLPPTRSRLSGTERIDRDGSLVSDRRPPAEGAVLWQLKTSNIDGRWNFTMASPIHPSSHILQGRLGNIHRFWTALNRRRYINVRLRYITHRLANHQLFTWHVAKCNPLFRPFVCPASLCSLVLLSVSPSLI